MKRILWGVVIVVAIALLAMAAFRRPLTLALVKRQAYNQLSAQWFNHLPDSLNVVLCGAGGPMPDRMRAGPCSVVIAGRHVFVIDVGPGSVLNILLAGIPMGNIGATFLTHYHSDHIGDLGELEMQRWIGGAHHDPLPVYGPTGVEQVVAGFNAAYTLDDGYRTAHHGPEVAPPSGAGGIAHTFALPAIGQDTVVYDQDGVKVSAFAVDHGPVKPAVGYRFDYKGRSIVFSGDTRPTPNLVRAARDADVLVDEGLSHELLGALRTQAQRAGRTHLAQILHDVLNYHTSPVEAAREAQQAGVRDLLFNHVTPPLPLHALQSIYLQGVSAAFHGKVELGEDGTWLSLPVNSTAIEVGSRR